MSEPTKDRYDEAVEYLTAHPDQIQDSWNHPFMNEEEGGLLFQFCSPTGHQVVSRDEVTEVWCGCPTQVRGFGDVAWTDDLTARIRADKSIPASNEDIRPEHLPRFAYWQRVMDKEIRGKPE